MAPNPYPPSVVILSPQTPGDSPAGEFPPTQWQLMNQSRMRGRKGARADEELCRIYWNPVYHTLRKRGHTTHDAEDLTQEFFLKQLDEGIFHTADRERGEFRSLLMTTLNRFLIDRHRAGRARKRGGGVRHLSFNEADPAGASFQGPQDIRDPERIHLLIWVRSVIGRARMRLRATFKRTIGMSRSQALEPYLDPDAGPVPYAELSRRFAVSQNALRLHLHRLRERFASLLLEEVGMTVDNPGELADELKWFLAVVRSA